MVGAVHSLLLGALLAAAPLASARSAAPGALRSPDGLAAAAERAKYAPQAEEAEHEPYDAVCRGDAACLAKGVYERAPWDSAEEFVSLDPVQPVPGDGGLMGAIFTEAENFTLKTTAGNLSVTGWGRDHYYGATFENTFAHRKALLHSSAGAVGQAVSPGVHVPTSATYYVCVRYEAAYLFETEFTLTVKQGSAQKFQKIYGQRASTKLWAFGWSETNHEIAGCGPDPTAECHWTWGATENCALRSCSRQPALVLVLTSKTLIASRSPSALLPSPSP